MSVDRAVLHKTIAEKHSLALYHVLVSEENFLCPPYNSCRNRRLIGISSVGKKTQNKKAKDHDEGDGLNPALRDEKATVPRFFHIFIPHFLL